MLRSNQLDVDRAFVLVIDLQEKLLPLVRRHDRVIAAGRKLLDGARAFALPVLATEQYPKGIGPTDETIKRCLKASRACTIEKTAFSAWAEDAVREAILAIDRPQAILIGIEAHVCVQQTALDLQSRDYDVFVCADAVGSRGRLDCDCSLERMRQEGAYVTTVEAVLFELCNRRDTPQFAAMLEVIKETPPADN
jgi:isochorismate hydrolase